MPITFFLGTNISDFANSFRAIFFYTIIVSFFWLNNSIDEIFLFGYLLVPYLLLIIFSQIYLLSNVRQFITLFDPTFVNIAKNSVTGAVRITVSGVLIVYYNMFFGYQLIINKKYVIFNKVGEIILILSAFSLFISATRVWISITLLCFLVYQITIRHKIRSFISVSIIIILFYIIFNTLGIFSFDYFERNIWGRYYPTVEALVKGDLNQTDTFTDRITNDIPKVMKGVKVSPILGVGLSDIYRKQYSNDVGFYNTILLLGVSGTIIFFYFIFYFYAKMSKLSKDKVHENKKSDFIPFKVIWAGILLGYFFTWDFFSFYPEKVFFISIIIASAEFILNQYKEQPIAINKFKTKEKDLVGVFR